MMNSMGGSNGPYSGQVQPQDHVPITPYSNPSHQNMNMNNLNSNGTSCSTDEATAIASATAMNDIYDKHSGSPMSRSGSMSPMYNVHRQSAGVGAGTSMPSRRPEFGAELVRNPDGSFLLDQDNKPIPIAKLLATKPLRAELSTRPGPGGKKLTYLSGDSVTRTLNDIFGFDGWCLEVKETRKECCERDDKKRYCVSYTALVRVTHRASGAFKEDCGSGDSTDRSLATAVSHALKASVTDAMKRAARHFGDKLGNSLYESSFSIKKAPADLKNALTMHNIERAKSKFGFEKDRKKPVDTSNTSSSSNLGPSSMNGNVNANANASVHSNANANAKPVGSMNGAGVGNTSISTGASKQESMNQRIARGATVATAPALSRVSISTHGVGAGTGARVAPSATSSSGVGTSGNSNNNIAYETPGANRPTAISRVNVNTGNNGNRNNGTTNSHAYGVTNSSSITSSTNVNNRSNVAANVNKPSNTSMNQQSKAAAASSTPAGCTMSVTVSTSNSIMSSNATPKPNLKSASMASTAYKSSHGVSLGTGMANTNSNLIASTATPINRQVASGVSLGMANSNSNLRASTATPINHRVANNSKPTGGLGLARFQATPIQNQKQKTAPRQFISNASATTNPYLSNQQHRQQLQQQQQQQRSNPISSNSSISSAAPPPFANRTRPSNASNKSNTLANISTNLSKTTPLSYDNKNQNGKRPYQATNPYMNNKKK